MKKFFSRWFRSISEDEFDNDELEDDDEIEAEGDDEPEEDSGNLEEDEAKDDGIPEENNSAEDIGRLEDGESEDGGIEDNEDEDGRIAGDGYEDGRIESKDEETESQMDGGRAEKEDGADGEEEIEDEIDTDEEDENEDADEEEDGTNGFENADEEIDGGEDDDEEIGEDEDDEDDDIDEDDEDGEDDDIDEDDEDDEDDDIDEGDEDEDDEDEDEYASRGSESSEESRRIYRRKRRIRNQIIAYGVVLIFAAILVWGGVKAGHRISIFVKERQLAKQQAQEIEEQQKQLEEQKEKLIVETPPVIDEAIDETEDVVDSYDEQLEEFIGNCILEMPLEDKVAGLFVITPEALTGVRTVVQAGEGTREALGKYAVGGLVYFAQNILNKEQLTGMLSNTISMSKYPVFLAVDEEGGSVSRVANSRIEVMSVDDMATIGASGNPAMAHEAGAMIGSYLNEIGFNLDFAPVADVANTRQSILGERSFGADANVAADMVANMVEGIQGNGVSACLKHFPGIGSTKEDTHEGRVETTKTLEEMRKSDFIPFQAGIEAGADFVMVSHVTASGVDADGLPSSLSRVMITDVLRGELGYDGIVITDALNMNAIAEYYTSEEAAVNAIRAGADMLLMPEDFEAAYRGLLAAVQDGRVSEERIDESLRRIYRIKYADKLR